MASVSEIESDRVFRITEQQLYFEMNYDVQKPYLQEMDIKVRDRFGEETHPWIFKFVFDVLEDISFLSIFGDAKDSKLQYEKSYCKIEVRS